MIKIKQYLGILEFNQYLFVSTGNVYPGVKHSLDVWHGAKNLGSKIIGVSLCT